MSETIIEPATAGAEGNRLSDKVRRKIALARFTPDEHGHLPSVSELAETFGRSRATIKQAITDAVRRGLVQVRCDPCPELPARDSDLEGRLADAFKVDEPLVLRGRDEERPRFDDLQAHLGWMMGRWIASQASSIFEADTFAVVTTGRAVRGCISALRKLSPIQRWKGAAAGSLCGSIGEKPAISRLDQENVILDADSLATNLCCCIGNTTWTPNPVRLYLVAHPVAMSDAAAAKDTLDQSWLRQEWRPPDIGLLGVGGLTEDHRFYGSTKEGAEEKFLLPVSGLVRRLYKLTASHTTDEYSPIGLIAHRLFWVDPPPGSEANSIKDDAEKLMRRINERLVTVDLKNLADIGRVYLMGGGYAKARVIYQALTGGPPKLKVRGIAVDSRTAERLLSWIE